MRDFFDSPELKTYLFIAGLVLILLNTIVLDVNYLKGLSARPISSVSHTGSSVSSSDLQCPQSCVDQISQATKTISKSSPSAFLTSSSGQAVLLPSPTPEASATPSPTPTAFPQVKEFFIPLGTGYGNSFDWTNIPGIGAYINPSNYGQISKVTLEVTVRIPTGNQTVYVRMLNADSYQSVVNSDLSLSGGTTTILVSSPITLAPDNHQYILQLKTQLGYLTYIDQARIRIQTK